MFYFWQLIANLMLNLQESIKEAELYENVNKCTKFILDFIFAKEICAKFSRAALKTEGNSSLWFDLPFLHVYVCGMNTGNSRKFRVLLITCNLWSV